MKISTRLLIGIFLICFTGIPVASAQVVIYKLEFEDTGESINYSFYDGGYVIAPAAGGAPSYLFTFRDGGSDMYTKFEEFGEYFMAINGAKRKAVLATDSDNLTNLFALMAVGEPNVRLRVDSAGFIATVDTALSLRGHILSADDESELPFDNSVGNLGYAGSSEVKASLQRERTDRANSQLLSVAEALADLEAELQRKGATEFVLGTGDGDGDGADGGDGDGDGADGGDGDGADGGDGDGAGDGGNGDGTGDGTGDTGGIGNFNGGGGF